jgi:hypothetical protein
MSDYDAAMQLIAGHLDGADFAAQPQERVLRAEEALGVRFPGSYRRFLVELGAGGIGGEEIYGLVNDDFQDVRPPQAIGLTLDLRRSGDISTDLVVIYSLGQGSYYALDTARATSEAEAPVVAFTPGIHRAGDRLQVVAKDFARFFLDIMRPEVS